MIHVVGLFSCLIVLVLAAIWHIILYTSNILNYADSSIIAAIAGMLVMYYVGVSVGRWRAQMKEVTEEEGE